MAPESQLACAGFRLRWWMGSHKLTTIWSTHIN
jgi:hypothetical protein